MLDALTRGKIPFLRGDVAFRSNVVLFCARLREFESISRTKGSKSERNRQ